MRSGVLFKIGLASGAVLAVALLVQTAISYRYVSENLVAQEARRAADDRVRGVERSARMAHAADAAALQAVLDDFRDDVADQVASVALVQLDGTVVAASGRPATPVSTDAVRRALSDRNPTSMVPDVRGGREVFVGVFPSRLRLVAAEGPAARLFIEMAIARESLSAPFARVRRNAIISASAALALLLALGLIAFRVNAYVRGKQLEGQVALARDVQNALLPTTAAWPAGVDAAARCLPASSVGGDFYDVRALPDGRLACAIGDVSGHGLPAALLMSLLHGAMAVPGRNAIDEAPEHTAARLNELLRTRSTGERFASVLWCILDPSAGVIRYVNAGHPPGVLLGRAAAGERVTRLADGGPVLGVVADAEYHSAFVTGAEGDLLVLYSDGIVETANRQEEYYGEGRLLEVLERHRECPATSICDEVFASVNAFAGGRPAADDRTLLVVRLWSPSPLNSHGG